MSISEKGNDMFASLHLVRASTFKDLREDMCGWNVVHEGEHGAGFRWRGGQRLGCGPFKDLGHNLEQGEEPLSGRRSGMI